MDILLFMKIIIQNPKKHPIKLIKGCFSVFFIYIIDAVIIDTVLILFACHFGREMG